MYRFGLKFGLKLTALTSNVSARFYSCLTHIFRSFLFVSVLLFFSCFMFHTRIVFYLYSYVTNYHSPSASVFGPPLGIHPKEITLAQCYWFLLVCP